MGKLKKLAGQTAIYGLPSILGRFLNYLLFPLYTAVFVPAEYGVVNDIYALVAFVAVILPWGLETAFFRFSNKENYSPDEVFKTSLFFVTLSSVLFLTTIVLFTDQIAAGIRYADHPEYVLWMGFTLGFDALSVIPLAQLRNEGRAVKFAVVNFTSIGINILLNLFFVWYCMTVYQGGGNAITDFAFDPSIGVGYIFIANMVQAFVKFLLISSMYKRFSFAINGSLLKELIGYSMPLVIAGFAGIINETLDRRLIRVLLEPTLGTQGALAQVGIYGAVYKLAVLITLFTQAFRYAAEPFFFAQDKSGDGKTVYADVMKWYTIVVTSLFLVVMLYLDLFKLLIRSEAYWEGLTIVPILLMANIFLGWIYNFSVWYKLTHKTIYGAILAVLGGVITIALNLYLIPIMGYTGAAWTTFTAYGVMALISYLLGRKFYPIPYSVSRLIGYPLLVTILWWISIQFQWEAEEIKWLFNTSLLIVFGVFVLVIEKDSIMQIKKMLTKK